jgi:hypothetical protein
MGIFSKKSDWEETFRINAIGRGGRSFCSVTFWIWGLGGLIAIGFEFMSIPAGVGVGTSSYIAAQKRALSRDGFRMFGPVKKRMVGG